MNDESPFPPALPAVVPSPLGPAISYSNIRAVTSRAERLLDGLDKKVRNRLRSGMNDSGMVGATLESKVRQRLADQLAPAENLFSDTVDLVQNQIAGNLAPAVATLEDLQGSTGASQASQSNTETAGHGTHGAAVSTPQATKPLTRTPALRATGLARQLSAAAGLVAGGPPISPFVQPCANPPDAAINAVIAALVAYENAHPNPPLPIAYDYWLDPNCCVFTQGEGNKDPELQRCSIHFGVFEMTASDAPNVLALIVNTLRQNGVPAATGNCTASCSPGGGVDCTVHPLDPSCPPDCKTHPEDPRCPPTTPTCPPPCIEVTCPPPIINVPPCPSLTPTSCVQIDLCDYDKFCKFIKDCITQSKEDCALDNETAYTFKDCDGTFGQGLRDLLGSLDGGSLAAPDMEDFVNQSLADIAALGTTTVPAFLPAQPV